MDNRTAVLERPTDCPYDADYYLRGKETGKSLYANYSWLPSLTIPMCEAIATHLGAKKGDSFLDFGCARGYVVRGLCELGYDAFGVDCSPWAIDNCDPAVKGRVTLSSEPWQPAEWVLAKDVLEHLTSEDLHHAIRTLSLAAMRGLFIVVPLSSGPGEPYVVPEYEQDVTHKQRMTLDEWDRLVTFLVGTGFCVKSAYAVPGVKENWAHIRHGNGFLTCMRVNP